MTNRACFCASAKLSIWRACSPTPVNQNAAFQRIHVGDQHVEQAHDRHCDQGQNQGQEERGVPDPGDRERHRRKDVEDEEEHRHAGREGEDHAPEQVAVIDEMPGIVEPEPGHQQQQAEHRQGRDAKMLGEAAAVMHELGEVRIREPVGDVEDDAGFDEREQKRGIGHVVAKHAQHRRLPRLIDRYPRDRTLLSVRSRCALSVGQPFASPRKRGGTAPVPAILYY
ncbi:MAG: hypothetical protein WDO24_30455 [Pseudomonadota bacterium]